MKRVLFAAMLMGITGVAAACPAAPPPGYSPPTVLSIVVGPVVAGQDFTVTASAIDDGAVSQMRVDFTVPASVRLEATYVPHVPAITCAPPSFAPQSTVTVEFACSAAAHAANGTWVATVTATDGTAPGYAGHGGTGFEVTGGTDDVAPPVVDSVVIAPEPVTTGAPVVVTIRLSDEHALDVPRPLSFVRTPDAAVACEETGRQQLSPTQVELVHTCPAPVATGSAQVYLLVRDVVGNTTQIQEWTTVTDA